MVFLSACALLCCGIGPGFGDAGGFSGSSSYGGGGGSFGGGSFGGGSSGGSYHYYGSSGSSGDDDLELGDVIFIIIVMVVIVLFSFLKSKAEGTLNKPQPAGASRTPDTQLSPISTLVERDPDFSASTVEEMIANVYVQMQHNWTAGNFEPMRPYFSNKLFSQFSNQLKEMTASGRVNYVENIAVLETHIRGWYETEGNEYIVMKVRTRIVDYTLDKDGKVVSGFKDKESYMEYEYVLARSSGSKTSTQTQQTVAGQCPNCGAPLNVSQSAKCDYCGTVIEAKDHTWVIVAIKGVSQQIV